MVILQVTADSCLFNFTDGKDITTAKLGYVNSASRAICCGNNFGTYSIWVIYTVLIPIIGSIIIVVKIIIRK